MRLLAFIAVLTSAFGFGESRAADEGAEIRATISDLISALREDDAKRVAALASPRARRADLAGLGHPVLRTPADLRFTGFAEAGAHRLQSVLMTDAAGALYFVDCDMVREGERWAVNGMLIRKAAES